MEYSPYQFLNHKWEDGIWTYLILSLIVAFISCFPVIIFHIIMYLIPALYPKESLMISSYFIYLTVILSLYWFSAPFILYNLPTYNLTLHTETIQLTPILIEFLELVIDYYVCTIVIIILPLLIKIKSTRKFIYLFAILFSSIFGDFLFIFIVFIPIALYIEISFFLSGLLDSFQTS
jgi:Sec-independent protein secretion pathway component TatC